MKPDATLLCGDMRDLLPKLARPVHMICSDVPYLLTAGGGTTGEMGGKFAKGKYDNGGAIIECEITFDEFMPLCFAVMPRGHAYFMVNNRNIAKLENAAVNAGFHLHNWLVWDKGIATPNRWYMKNLEFTGMFKTGPAFHINDCSAKQIIKCPPPAGAVHDTQKPVALMEYYIRNSTKPGDTVLDPFMGSGTTGVAAISCGRNFIGIEIDKDHFTAASKRISGARVQPDMFTAAS